MTQFDINFFRTRAIKFYGRDGYEYYKTIAEKFMTDSGITIPSDGVERMPTYWATINELIRYDSTKD
jgi:hypothetical protein